MALIRPISTVTIEPPQIDGMIAAGGHHWGYNWDFGDTRGKLSPVWMHAGTEYIEAMRAVAPLAYTDWQDMALTAWQAWDYTASEYVSAESHDDWRLSRPAWGVPRYEYAHFIDASAGARGRLLSEGDLDPCLHARLVRAAPVDGETRVPRVYIELLGDGTNDYSYGIVLPWQAPWSGGPNAHAKLYRWPYGEDAGSATLPMATHEVPYGGLRATELELVIEQLGDYLRVAWLLEGTDDWIVRISDDPLVPGPVAVGMIGQAGHIAIQEREWIGTNGIWYQWATVGGREVLRWQVEEPDPTTGWTQGNPFVIPRSRMGLHAIMQTAIGSATYYEPAVGDAPTGTSIAVTEDDNGTTSTRPQISFGTTTATQRPISIRIAQANRVTLSEGSGSGEEIAPTRVRWHRNSDWRGAHMTIDYADDAVGESIVEVTPNSKVTFGLVWDEGQETPPTPVDRIVGYTRGMHRRRAGSYRQGAAVPRIEARDHPSSRLRRHLMRSMPCFQNWTAEDIFDYVLASAGVPSALRTVDPAVTSSYRLPAGDPPWERHWSYSHTYQIEAALDEMLTDVLGLQWGWDADGYFVRPRPEWGGIGVDTVDWTADRDEEDVEIACTDLTVMTSIEDFANYVMEATPDGNYALAIDADSHRLATAENYVGEDWWAGRQSASDYDEAQAAATARLERLSRHAVVITFTTAYDGLAPDEFVAATNWDVPEFLTGSVFRVLEEDGEAWSEGHDNGVRVTYTCGIEEFAVA